MTDPFDIIVVGSGFGGAVTACRAAEAGARVLILERGRRWNPQDYPRGPKDPWYYDVNKPEKRNGWLDLRLLRGMAVAQGAGVGGGSLCYSSVLLDAPSAAFGHPWPAEISDDELRPYFMKARQVLDPKFIPEGQRTPRYRLLRDAAGMIGQASRFASAPLAISFDESFSPDADGAIDARSTKAFLNAHGAWQGTCVHLGNCDIGCDVRAKNTLDLNYLARAERRGAEIRPLSLVRAIARDGTGYRVHFDCVESGRRRPGSVQAGKVVVAAGSLGSTEILLRCRDEWKTLPQLSPRLGCRWSGNGNFMSVALYNDSQRVRQGIGPTISAALDLSDGCIDGRQFIVEDDGFPNVWLNALRQASRSPWMAPIRWGTFGDLSRGRAERNPFAHVMLWLGAGKDAGDGRLRLRRRLTAPWSHKLSLQWDAARSRALIDAISNVHRKLTETTGGTYHVPFFWRLFGWSITVHPLGGCAMGATPLEGVVDHRGEVHGYPGLFVSDGAVFPAPIGINPSLTIATLAERTSQFISGSG